MLPMPGAQVRLAVNVLHLAMFLVLAVVGAVGLLRDAQQVADPVAAAGAHTTFGLILLASMAARHCWYWRFFPYATPAQRCAFARCSSRMVYLLLYSLVGLQLALDISKHLPGGLHTGNCQVFLAYGVAALTLIRVLTFNRSGHRALRVHCHANNDGTPNRTSRMRLASESAMTVPVGTPSTRPNPISPAS
jgi:hypothetical protein